MHRDFRVNHLLDYFVDTWSMRTVYVCIDFIGLMDAWSMMLDDGSSRFSRGGRNRLVREFAWWKSGAERGRRRPTENEPDHPPLDGTP